MLSPNNQIILDNLLHNITTLRRQYGLSKKAMARLLGVSLYSLNQMEQGRLASSVGVELVFRVKACFGVSIDDLFGKRL